MRAAGSLASALFGGAMPVGPGPSPEDVAFPPRDQSYRFGQDLNVTYRDQLGRGTNYTYVDLEGWIVWIQEYLRYRVNGCSHAEAEYRVGYQIGGGGVPPVCGGAPTGTVAFPPRDQSYQFGVDLNDVYRYNLGRSSVGTYVDLEGWIVWIQEYLRYRVNYCSHDEAAYRVGYQIGGGGVLPVCSAGGYIDVVAGSGACSCWIGTITVYVDGSAAGSLTCTSSVRVSASPGTHTLRLCDRTECITRVVTVPTGGVVTLTLTCGSLSERVAR
jgi:hypothetical protein